jgi:hypothetical protein
MATKKNKPAALPTVIPTQGGIPATEAPPVASTGSATGNFAETPAEAADVEPEAPVSPNISLGQKKRRSKNHFKP